MMHFSIQEWGKTTPLCTHWAPLVITKKIGDGRENCVTWAPNGPHLGYNLFGNGKENVFKTTHWASFGQKIVKGLRENCATWSPNAPPLLSPRE